MTAFATVMLALLGCVNIWSYWNTIAQLDHMAEQNGTPTEPRNADSIITTQRNGQTIVAELFFNHSSTETFRDKLLKTILADSSCLSASDGQEPEKSEILR